MATAWRVVRDDYTGRLHPRIPMRVGDRVEADRGIYAWAGDQLRRALFMLETVSGQRLLELEYDPADVVSDRGWSLLLRRCRVVCEVLA